MTLEATQKPMRRPVIGIAGASGRMGRAVLALGQSREDLTIGAAFGRPENEGDPRDGVRVSTATEALRRCNVIIDFTEPAASTALAGQCAAQGGPALVIGSTGFSDQQDEAIRDAAMRIAIVKSGNFSLGVNLLAALVEQAARRLPSHDWDIEVLEAHHRRKVDSPSGTALMLGHAAARGGGRALGDPASHTSRTGPRLNGAIGFSVVRGGGIVGEHSVIFAGEDEILTLSHSARDRSLFARGALQAALWVFGRAPGLYDMMDVLGFRDPPPA